LTGLEIKNKQAIELISLNTNGLREDRKRIGLFNWLKKFHKADDKIVLLQETHADTANEELWKTDWGHKNIIFAHGNNRSRGVAIILPKNYEYNINDTVTDPDGRYIALDITIDDNKLWILNCYAPTTSEPIAQLSWLNKVQELIEQAGDTNIIVAGDLNDYFMPKLDKYNAKVDLTETDYVMAWKALCQEENLTDIWRILNPNLKRYTWRQGKSTNTLRQSRLDYFLISTHMIYDLENVDILPGFRSDHSLIEINFKGHKDSNRGPSYWRFNSSLLRDTEYVTYMNNRIDEIIEKHKDTANAGLKWDVIKMEIRSSTVCYSKLKSQKNNIQEVILRNNELSKLIDEQPSEEILKEYEATKLEIEYYNNEKANGVLMRSKCNMIEMGEKNTKYFLNLEKQNYKINVLLS
jgi:exonuclease III